MLGAMDSVHGPAERFCRQKGATEMTEQDWLACTNPYKMLEFLRGKASERKLRLFACAVCVQVASRIGNGCSDAVAVAERYAAGQKDDCDLFIATAWLESKLNPISNSGELDTEFMAVGHVCLVGEQPGFNSIRDLATRFDGADILRCIFNPYHTSVSMPPAVLNWNDSTICRLAEAIYDERAFDRLPIFADVLEEAGCDNANILNHCRQEGVHFRGCWVVDLLLGKQ
jgi:hypothetical protein